MPAKSQPYKEASSLRRAVSGLLSWFRSTYPSHPNPVQSRAEKRWGMDLRTSGSGINISNSGPFITVPTSPSLSLPDVPIVTTMAWSKRALQWEGHLGNAVLLPPPSLSLTSRAQNEPSEKLCILSEYISPGTPSQFSATKKAMIPVCWLKLEESCNFYFTVCSRGRARMPKQSQRDPGSVRVMWQHLGVVGDRRYKGGVILSSLTLTL